MATIDILRPGDTGELIEMVADAAFGERHLEVRGGGTKRGIGAPDRHTTIVETAAFSGVVDYEPSELVLTVRPATPLAAVEALLAEHRQMLAFEPWDHGSLLGAKTGSATIGGVVAAGVAGPRRVTAGGARDHLLGFAAVSGRGEAFKGGGKVVKNVTGYDTPKLMAGSWGQLAIFTELSLKVLPRPRFTATVAIRGLGPAAAVAAMAQAVGSRCGAAAAAYLPARHGDLSVTALRLEGFRQSVEARAEQLRGALSQFGGAELLEEREGEVLWSSVRLADPLAAADTVWRAQVAPSRSAGLADALDRLEASWFCDWGGALLWIGAPAHADIRAAVAQHSGHATLVRGPLELRRAIPARNSENPAVAALEARVKQGFDPAGVLDPHRFT